MPDEIPIPEEIEAAFDNWDWFQVERRPISRSPRDTWDAVKAERRCVQNPGETVRQMDLRLGNGLSQE